MDHDCNLEQQPQNILHAIDYVFQQQVQGIQHEVGHNFQHQVQDTLLCILREQVHGILFEVGFVSQLHLLCTLEEVDSAL